MMVAEIVPLPLPEHYTTCRKRKWEVLRHHVVLSILLFDRHHPSVPTCAQPVPSRAAAVKDGRLRATAPAARSVLDGREHDGMLGRVGKPIPSRAKQNIKK